MAFKYTIRCSGYDIDVYDTNRISTIHARSKYYLTPKKLAEVEAWGIKHGIHKFTTPELVQQLIDLNLIGNYDKL